VDHFYQNNKNWIDPLSNGAMAAASVLLAPEPETDDPTFSTADYLYRLKDAQRALKHLSNNNRYGYELIQSDILFLRDANTRILPYSSLPHVGFSEP